MLLFWSKYWNVYFAHVNINLEYKYAWIKSCFCKDCILLFEKLFNKAFNLDKSMAKIFSLFLFIQEVVETYLQIAQ